MTVTPENPLVVKGYMKNGDVSFDGSFVTIHRRGFTARATVGKGDVRLPISQITEVRFKPAGGLVNGFILFVTAGMQVPNAKFGSQMKDLSRLPSAVIFTKKGQADFEHLREVVEQAIADHHSKAGSTTIVQQNSEADELAKLADLRDKGILTDEEFAAKKAQILGL